MSTRRESIFGYRSELSGWPLARRTGSGKQMAITANFRIALCQDTICESAEKFS